MDLGAIAQLKPADEFYAAYTPGAEQEEYRGLGLLMRALLNTDPDSRYATVPFLLDRGAPLGPNSADGSTTLHALFGHQRHDLGYDEEIARGLLALGADINAKDRMGRMPIHYLLQLRYTDEALRPIYDLWFQQPALDFTSPTRWGTTPIDLATGVAYHAEIARRMAQYAAEHPASRGA